MSFTLASWNIATTPHWSSVGMSHVEPHIGFERQDILCLQEFATTDALDESITPYLYTQAAQPSHNAILTRYRVLETLDLPVPVKDPRVCFEPVQMARLEVQGRELMVYNCHLPIIHAGFAHRLPMLRGVLEHASQHSLPSVICGDLNSTLPAAGWRRLLVRLVHRVPAAALRVDESLYVGDERELVNDELEAAGFAEAFALPQATWAFPRSRFEPLSLKLDWVSVRGLTIIDACFDDYVTDHRRLFVTLGFL